MEIDSPEYFIRTEGFANPYHIYIHVLQIPLLEDDSGLENNIGERSNFSCPDDSLAVLFHCFQLFVVLQHDPFTLSSGNTSFSASHCFGFLDAVSGAR